MIAIYEQLGITVIAAYRGFLLCEMPYQSVAILYLRVLEIKHRRAAVAGSFRAELAPNLPLFFRAMRNLLRQLHQATGAPKKRW